MLALEISSFAVFGQLCILYTPPGIFLQMLSSQPIKIWSKVQYNQCKFSKPVLKCQREKEGLSAAEQSITDLLSTHSMHTDLRAWDQTKHRATICSSRFQIKRYCCVLQNVFYFWSTAACSELPCIYHSQTSSWLWVKLHENLPHCS